jgi:hypothetical protein
LYVHVREPSGAILSCLIILSTITTGYRCFIDMLSGAWLPPQPSMHP